MRRLSPALVVTVLSGVAASVWTFIFSVDRARLLAAEAGFSERFARVAPGDTPAVVERLLGAPDSRYPEDSSPPVDAITAATLSVRMWAHRRGAGEFQVWFRSVRTSGNPAEECRVYAKRRVAVGAGMLWPASVARESRCRDRALPGFPTVEWDGFPDPRVQTGAAVNGDGRDEGGQASIGRLWPASAAPLTRRALATPARQETGAMRACVLVVFMGCGPFFAGCEGKSGMSLRPDPTIMPYTENRDGYRFVAPEPVRVSLRVKQTGEEDRVLQRRFDRGQTVGLGYRLQYSSGLDPDRPDIHEARCALFLGLVEEEPGERTDFPANWPEGTKLPIRFRTSGSPSGTFARIRPQYPPAGEEQLLFRLAEGKGGLLALWFSIEVLGGK